MAETDAEWKNARQWIISTGVSMENRSMQYTEELLEFAESLRDGIILCAIANKMKPGCVHYRAKVNNITQHEYLCKRNIDLFLRACRETFHIEEKNLFTPTDLYHLVNFKAVLKTLAVLSNKREATDFLRWTPISCQKKRAIHVDEDLYGTLPDIIDERANDQSYNTTTDEPENIYDEVEKIYSSSTYDSLISYKKLPLQNSSVPTSTVQTQTLSKRDHIINEILDTEEGYVKNLESMVKHYIPALRSQITAEDKETVFLNTEKIFMVHLNFQRELKNEKSFKTVQVSGDSCKIDISAFLRYKEQFLLYAFYCTHLDDAQRRVSELSKAQSFRNTIDDLNKKLDRKFPLQEQLAVCFQRVLKYPLLLRDLKKSTPDEHSDAEVIQNAHDAMDDVAKYINEYKRDTEIVSEIKHIQSTLKFDMPVFNRSSTSREYGRHLKDGELQVQFENSDKKEKRFSFLFEHALLLCKSRGESNEVKEVLDLGKFVLEDVPTAGKGNFTHCLKLRARVPDGVSDMKNCKIFTKTQQLKIYWISAITKCIEAVTLSEFVGRLHTHAFSLTTFKIKNEDGSDRSDKCGVCNKLLLGLISQGYLCTKGCQLVVHRDCLLNCPPCHQQPSRHVSHVVKKKNPRDRNRAKTLDMTAASVEKKMPEELKRASLHKQKSLDTYSWFAGVLSRDQATDMLKGCPNGAFLIRESEKGGLVISIQYNDNCFHIKITERNNQVFLTDAKQFRSVDELIIYYETNSLGTSFPTVPSELTQIVRKPIKRSMVAIHNWQAQSAKELSLKEGDVISVLQDDGNWWVGVSSNGQQGYFPSNYVK